MKQALTELRLRLKIRWLHWRYRRSYRYLGVDEELNFAMYQLAQLRMPKEVEQFNAENKKAGDPRRAHLVWDPELEASDMIVTEK